MKTAIDAAILRAMDSTLAAIMRDEDIEGVTARIVVDRLVGYEGMVLVLVSRGFAIRHRFPLDLPGKAFFFLAKVREFQGAVGELTR